MLHRVVLNLLLIIINLSDPVQFPAELWRPLEKSLAISVIGMAL